MSSDTFSKLGGSHFGASSLSINRARTPFSVLKHYALVTHYSVCNGKLFNTGNSHTSQKLPDIGPINPCSDILYSRIKHWSSVCNLPSRIDLNATFKDNGELSLSLRRVVMHHVSFLLLASISKESIISSTVSWLKHFSSKSILRKIRNKASSGSWYENTRHEFCIFRFQKKQTYE
jgi:hypothetical protein